MIVSNDFVERLKVMGIFSLEIYKVVTGTLLTIFIPQSCEVLNDANQTSTDLCSLQDNFDNRQETPYREACVYVSFASLAAFLGTYMIELRRENYAIQHLDSDKETPENELRTILKDEPTLEKNLDRLNLIYWRSLLLTTLLYGTNLGLSYKVLNDHASSSTISTAGSLVLLIAMKLYNSLSCARRSLKEDLISSAYMKEFVTFNVLDKDYVEKKIELRENNHP